MKQKKKMYKPGVTHVDSAGSKVRRVKHIIETWKQQTRDGCCEPNVLLQRISNIVGIKA